MNTKIVVTFTSGHVSIRRGRVTRQYHPFTVAAMTRLTNVLYYGATSHRDTNRSSIYIWYGFSTLNPTQRIVLKMYQDADERYNRARLLARPEKPNYNLRHPFPDEAMLDIVLTLQDVCRAIGIHELVINPHLCNAP